MALTSKKKFWVDHLKGKQPVDVCPFDDNSIWFEVGKTPDTSNKSYNEKQLTTPSSYIAQTEVSEKLLKRDMIAAERSAKGGMVSFR